jgi:hypothetical protein
VADDADAEPLRNLTFEYQLGRRYLYGQPGGKTLFTNNETNGPAVWGPEATSASPYVKDAFTGTSFTVRQASIRPRSAPRRASSTRT